MKKLLLTLLGTIALTSTANAVEPITADFSTWETTTISTTETTATVDGVKYGFLGANINKGYNDAPQLLIHSGQKTKRTQGICNIHIAIRLLQDRTHNNRRKLYQQ